MPGLAYMYTACFDDDGEDLDIARHCSTGKLGSSKGISRGHEASSGLAGAFSVSVEQSEDLPPIFNAGVHFLIIAYPLQLMTRRLQHSA